MKQAQFNETTLAWLKVLRDKALEIVERARDINISSSIFSPDKEICLWAERLVEHAEILLGLVEARIGDDKA